MNNDGSLVGLRVLLVEDESLVMMLLEDELAEIGCEVVGFATRLDEAVEKASSLSFDIAILDVNLHGQKTYPAAEVIAGRGLPFVLATGYDPAGLPPDLGARPVVQKPFRKIELERALRAALGGALA